ncbi:MAG: peptidoglycan DD-metalloendopeptidase family protein, partial [Oscillospiraceae bacterium]|nr:peptidoglycan DD-metalloendopeptidase family protein [Oscillospiraceae bacterium]
KEEIPTVSEKTKNAKISSESALVFIWALGGISVLGFFAAKHFYSVKRILKNSEPYDVPEIYKTGKTRFYKSKNLASPLSFGILRPAIVIPEGTEEKELHFVLLHEQTHIKDRDAVLKILALFALSLNWFNPLVWFMVKIFERDIERYCDERVLKKIGAEKALFYANTILDFAERESLSLNYFSAASLCERVTSIMKTKHKKQNIFVSVLVLAAVLLTITACGTLPEKEEKEPAETENLSANEEGLDKILQDMVEAELEKGEENTIAVLHGSSEAEKSAEEIAEEIGYMTFAEITAAGYYPDWMQPNSSISYDENGVPTITAGGELLPEDLVGRPEFSGKIPFTSAGSGIVTMMIQPNTMAEYDLHGFIRNIYYLWPDGNYNLSPPEQEKGKFITDAVLAFYWPCESRTISASSNSRPGHKGIDIATGTGADVFAAAGGVVTVAGTDENLGNYIIISHDYEYSTVYAHCSEILVKEGQQVIPRDVIAKTGSSGNSTGPHLHFEILLGNVNIDPESLLLER